MIKIIKKIKNRYEKKNTEFLQNKNYALDLLPKNSENIIEAGSKDLLNSTEENKKNKININQFLDKEIKSLKSFSLKNIFNLKENEHEQYRSQIIQRFSRCGI